VMPAVLRAKTSGWSASNDHSSCVLLLPEAEEARTFIVLCTPPMHLADARQENWAASGAP